MLAGVLERLLKGSLSRWLSVTASHLQVLNVGVWAGDLELQQLHMLPGVLDELRLPLGLGVKLRKGMVGSLRIKANWARLTTQPVEVRLADVYLLGEIDPTRLASQSVEDLQAQIAKLVDPEVIRAYMAGQKAAIIAAAEASWEQIKSADAASAAKNQSYMSSFTASLVASVLDNLSVTVQRIHVCIATAPKAQPIPLPVAAPASPHAAAGPDSLSPQIVSPQPANSSEDGAAAAASASSTAAAESTPVPPVLLPLPPIAVAPPAAAALPAAPSIPFPVGWSLGLVLSQLSFYATDKDGSPSFVKSTGSSVYKQVKLEAFALYLSTNATPLPDAAAGSDGLFMKLMAKPFAKDIEPEEEKSDSDEDEDAAVADAAAAAASAPAKADSAHNSDTSSDDEAKDAFEDAREHVPLRPSGSESSSPVIVPSNHRRSATAAASRAPQSSALKQSKHVFEKVEGLEYLLCPCDATVKLRLTKSGSRGGGGGGAAASDHSAAASSSAAESADERAKLSVNISVEKLQLEFTSKQYEILQALAANISSSEHALRHAPFIEPRERPGHSQQVTRAWWRYALDVTRKECRERLQQWDPRFILSYRRSFHDYAPLYAASLSRKITPLQSAHMHALEDEYDAHHIIMWRSLFHKQNRIKEALMHVSKQRGKQKKHAGSKSKKARAGDDTAAATAGQDDATASAAPEKSSGSVMGWLGSWLPSSSSSASSSGADDSGDASSLRLSEAEREQILKMLGYDPYASIEQMQAESSSLDNTMKLDFTLGQASITLFQAQIAEEAPPRPVVAAAARTKNGRRLSRVDPASLPNFPLAPRSLTTRQAFLIASLSDFALHAQQGNAGVSVELSLDHLLVEDRMASCERFAAIIMPRALQPKQTAAGGFQTPFMTPQRRRDQAHPEASPLLLPASAVTQDGGSPSLSPSSPELSALNSAPEPPLLQLRLSYYFPSTVLPSATTSSQAHIDLWLATQPLDIVYSAGAISTLQRFLLTPTSNPADSGLGVLWQELEVAAMNAFQDLKRRSAAKIDYVLNHHVRIGLDINIQAPTLLIYHHGVADQGSCLAINLGHVTCATQEKAAAAGGAGGTIVVVEPEEGSIIKNADSGTAWAMSSSLDASSAAARRRALSGEIGGSTASDAGTRSELFFDQFRLVIENMDVQLIPLYVDAKGVASLQSPLAQMQTPAGLLPSLQLPAAYGASSLPQQPQQRSLHGSPPPASGGGSRSSRSSSRKAWLARRRNLNSRSKRSFGCGPVIDAFTPTLHVMSSVLPSDTSLPRMKVFAHLPPLKLHLSSAKMRRIIDILASFPSMAAQVLAPVASATPHGGAGGHSNTPSFGSPSPSLQPAPRSSSLFADPSATKTPSNRRSSSSFQTSKESAVATAAQVWDSRANDKKDEAKPKLPADWIMLQFQLTASQLSIDLSFDCDAPPEQVAAAAAASASSPGFALEPISSTFELVSFLLEGVELSFTQFPYSSALEAQVLGLFVEDCINREHAACRFLIASGAAPRLQGGPGGAAAPVETKDQHFEHESMPPSATPAASQSALTGLIYLRYNHTTDASATAVSASSDDLQLDFNTLQFNLNRKTFQLLMEFIQPALDALEAPPAVLPTHSHPSHGHHAHFEEGGAAAAGGVDMSRSVDYTAAQLPSHSHAKSMPINLSASIGDVRASPASAAAFTTTGSPHTPERHSQQQQHASASPAAFTPARAASFTPARDAPPSQQDLLARISDKISSDGEVGSRANRSKFKPSALQVKLQARINLITLSLNQENDHDDVIATIAKTEIQGLSVSLQHQDCPCGGCTQATATLANLTLYETITTAPDNYSQYSRRSETHSAHLHPSYPLAHSSSANSLRDSLSPMPANDLQPSRGGFGGTRQKRIFWKRHASDTALISFAFTQHSLQMDSAAAKSSANCPIRFRTIRSGESDVPPVDPASLSFDQMVSVSLSSVQLVFVPDFLLRLQSYFEESLLKQAGDRAAEKARIAFTELKQLAEANCTLLKYGINIDNPLIFVPHTTTQPVNRPIMHSPSPSIPPMGSGFPMSGPSSPSAAFQMAHEHLYDDVRQRTDYLVLDLGKMSFSNHFLLSEERRALVPVPESAASSGLGGFQQPLFSSPRRKRKSMAPAGRVPMEQMQLRLSAMNLILASPPTHRPSDPSTADSQPSQQQPQPLVSDDAGQFWLTCSKKKIFEDVNVSADIALVMLVPHLAFVDVPNVRVHGTVSTIHAHVNEQLMTFLLGVYTVELAPLLAPPAASSSAGSHFDPEHDDMLQMEIEEDVPAPTSSKSKGGASPRKRASMAPPSSSERASLAARAAALKSFSADNIRDMEVSMSAELMASIDEELDDDPDQVPPTLAPATTEQVGVMVDLTFEGVVLDFLLTPPAVEAESHFNHHAQYHQPQQQQQPRNQRGSFLSPHAHAPFLTPMGGAAPLNHFPFVPVRHHPIQPRPQPFMQVSAKSLTVAYRLTNITQRPEIDADPVRSALTSIELSLGHLSLEDARPELRHSLLKQVIGGHMDYVQPRAHPVGMSHHRATSVAFDLSAAGGPMFSPAQERSASSAPPQTVLPDLKVRFESLAIERVAPVDPDDECDDCVEDEDGESSVAPVESVTVEMSVDVEFTAPRLVISPSFLTAVMGFADAYTTLIDAGLHADTRSEVGGQSNAPMAAPAVMAAPVPASQVEMRIHARVRDPQVWLMSDVDVVSHTAATAQTMFAASSPTPIRHASMSLPAGRFPTDMRDSTMPQHVHTRPLSCVVVRGNVEVTVKVSTTTAVQATVNDIEALMCYRAYHLRLADLNPQPVPVFKPFSIKADYQLRSPAAAAAPAASSMSAAAPSAPPTEQHLTVDIGLLDSCFSFLQMSSAANILLALVQAIPADDVAPAPKPPKSSSSLGVGSEAASSSPVAFLASFKGVVQVRTNGIQLALVNDAPGYYVPLLSFAINPLLLSVLDASHPESLHSDLVDERKSPAQAPAYLSSRFADPASVPARTGALLIVSMGLEAKYYNQSLGEFEQFVDSYRFDVRADERSIVLASKQLLAVQITPASMLAIAQGMDSLQTHFLSVLASAPRAPPPKRAASARRAESRNRGSVLRHPHAPPAVSPPSSSNRPGQQGNKASYFRVRNETGCRLRFWSVEVEHSGGGVEEVLSPKTMPSFTVDPNDEHTVALRQYIGVGGIGGAAASDEKDDSKDAAEGESKMRWLYRSPMLGLQLEAGRGTERWHAWHSIQAVPLVASTPDTHADAGAARTAVHAHTNLTLHPLLPSPEQDSGPDDIESDGDLSAGVIACHLVSQPDAFGSSAQVLVVSSALLLVNRTFVNMDVCLVDSVAEQVLFQQLVRSGQSLPMPVLLVPWRRVKLLLRPAGRWMDREWDWSSAGFRLSLLQYDAAKHTVLKCAPQSNEGEAPMHEHRAPSDGSASLTSNVFCCGLNIFTTAAASAPVARSHATSATLSLLEGIDEPEPTLYTIALDPPLSFKNLLGCDVSYQVTLRERREDASFIHTRIEQMDLVGRIHGSLPHRQEVHWYHMDLGAASSAVVTLQLRRGTGSVHEEHLAVSTPRSGSSHQLHSNISAGSAGSGDWTGEWSSEVVIHSTTDSTAPAESLILHDSEGVRLRIQLDYSAKQQNSIKSASAGVYPYAHAGEGLVTAFVPHWFSNHSGLPLVYATADDSIESDDTVQLCAGQSKQSLCHAAQALQDLEGLDYELALKQRGNGHEDSLQLDALSSDSSHKRSWFHFRDARREFGTETRSGLHALLPDPEQVIGEWKWTPELARRPLDEHVFLLSPVTRLEELLAEEEQQKDSQSAQPVEVYMLPVRDGEKRRARVRLPNTNWSQPFNVDTVGWDGTLQLTEQPRPPPSDDVPRTDSAYDLPRPSDRPFRVYTLGVSICMHPHLRFHRTKIIQFTPRYVLSNQTLHTLEFRQIGSAEVRTLKPKQQLPIHWLDQDAPVALSFRVDSYGWQWAAKRFGIALESVGVFSVRLRNNHTHDSAVMHVWTKLTEATFEITVLATWEQQRKIARPHMEASASLQPGSASLASSWTMQANQGGSLDLNSSLTTSQLLGLGSGLHVSPPSADDRDLAEKIEAEFLQNREEVPYRIENCSSMRILQFHQTDEPGLIQRLLPFQSCPYAWDEPGGKKMVELYCISGAEARSMHDGAPQRGQRVGSFSLDKIAKYDSVWLPKSGSGSGRDGSDGRKLEDQVFVQVYAHGRVRVLKLVDLAWANSAGLTQTQATLNAAASMQPAAATGWSVELRLAGIGLSLITHVHRSSAQTVSAASISHLRSSSASLSLASSVSSSSSHPLGVLGAPYTRQELLHLSIQNIRIRLHESASNQALKAAIGHIQLDNQLPTAVYPVVFCSVSKPTKTSLLGGIFGGGRSNQPKPGAEPELDLSHAFFNLDDASTTGAAGSDVSDGGGVGGAMRGIRLDRARASAAGKKGSKESTTPCWFSVSLLKSHERSAEGFLFLPGLAVRMQLLKINIEEKLINHLMRFGELLAPAIAILNKPAPVSSAEAAGHHVPGPHEGLERSGSMGAQQLLGMMSMQDEADLGASPMPLRGGDGGAPYTLGRSHSSSFSPSSDGSLTPNSINDSFDEHDGPHVAEVSFHTQQLGGGIVGRLALPAEAAPLSSLDYSRIDLHQRDAHPSGKVERDHHISGGDGGSDASGSSLALAPKLERPLILYFQQLVIHTIEIQVSMSSSGEQGEEDGLGGGNSSHPLRVVLRAVGATLLNFEDASLKFAALELPDVFASGEELTSLVQLHYLKQATSQLYRILGSSDFLGNPLSLFSTIATGAGDLIYKPAVGLTESPTGVVTGAFGGMSSFLRHLLYGFSSAGSRMTSSLAKGLSSLSMPDAHLQHGRPGLHVSLTQLIRMPRDGWKHRGLRGLVGGGLRAGVGLGGNVVGKVAQLMDMIRAIVNPLSKLQRTREPLFFQGGIVARLFHLRMARFITAYLSMHPHETFVAALEQVDATPILTGGRRLISTAAFIAALGPPAEQLGVITEAPALAAASSSAASSDAAAVAASPPPPPASAYSSAAASASPIRVPGGRVCLLLTSHTLVLFAVDEVGHRECRLLHSLPLEALALPIVSEARPAPHTLLTIEPQMMADSGTIRGAAGAARPRPTASQRRTRSARFSSTRLPLVASSAASSAWSSFLPDWLTRLFVGSPSATRHVLSVPVLLPPPVLAAMELLVAAARMQRQRQMQTNNHATR